MKVFVKPKEGLKVPRPEDGRHLKPEGEEVVHSTYWRRRENDGDITVTELSKDSSQAEVSEKSSAKKRG